MRKYFYKAKTLGFLFWHLKHEMIHVLLGLVWAWFLREQWNEFNPGWIILSIFGSLLPDIEHFIYFFSYGKQDQYTVTVKNLFLNRRWRDLAVFMSNGHKHNTNLAYHNLYFVSMLLIVVFLSSFLDLRKSTILFGAMVIHYLFDIVDDLVFLGHLNSNWKRWGRAK